MPVPPPPATQHAEEFLTKSKRSPCSTVCRALTHPFGKKPTGKGTRFRSLCRDTNEGFLNPAMGCNRFKKPWYVLIGRKKLFPRFHWAYRVSEENLARLPATCYLLRR